MPEHLERRTLRETALSIERATVFGKPDDCRSACEDMTAAYVALSSSYMTLQRSALKGKALASLCDELHKAANVSQVLARLFEYQHIDATTKDAGERSRKHQSLVLSDKNAPWDVLLRRDFSREVKEQINVLSGNSPAQPEPTPSSEPPSECTSVTNLHAQAQHQYEMAEAFQNEYVVMRGNEVLCHTLDIQEAAKHYYAAFDGDVTTYPVVLLPDRTFPDALAVARTRTSQDE